MRFILVYCFSVLFLLSKIFAQTTFQKVYSLNLTGFQVEDHINKLIVDVNQDFVFTGSSKEIIQQTSYASLYKTNKDGNLAWGKLYMYFPTQNSIRSLIQCPDNNYFLCGYLTDSTGGMYTSLIMKVDTSGDSIIWSKIIPFSPSSIYLEESFVSGNNIYCGGTINNFALGSLIDCYIIKINQEGVIRWSKFLSNNFDDALTDITSTVDSGCAFVGSMHASNEDDIYYGKFNSIGNRQWSKRILLPGTDDYAGLIKQTDDGGFFICGVTRTAGFGKNHILLIKIDSTGNVVWSKTYRSIKSETPISIDNLADKGLLISGYTIDSISKNALSLKVDSNGNIIWTKIYGLNNGSRFYASKVIDNYLLNIGSYNFSPPNGLEDIYFVKTDSLGFSGCSENAFLLTDSNISSAGVNVPDSVYDKQYSLIDISMTVFDITSNIVDSVLCFVNTNIDIAPDLYIKVFPNPSKGSIRLQFNEPMLGELEMYDTMGNIVLEKEINENDIELNLENFSSGFYILKLNDKNSKNIYSTKLIIHN